MIQKVHRQKETWLRELLIYEKLSGTALPCADIIKAEGLTIWMTRLPGETLVEVLEKQEHTGSLERLVWRKLVTWLVDFFCLTGYTMTDLNLRNFLYHADTQTVYGMDFEECAEDDLLTAIARLAAYIRNYTPENTQIKRETAEYVMREFSRQQNIELHTLFLEAEKQEAFLLKRRKNRI